MRYARDRGAIPAQCLEGVAAPSDIAFPDQCFAEVDIPVWHSVAPRLHFAYDMTGDGKTVMKGGWGRFDYIADSRPDFERLNANIDAVAIYDWRDLNGNNDYDPGEVDLDPNGDDFVETLGNELDDPAPRAVPNPNEKQPKADEFSLSLERELVANFAVRVVGIHARYNNIRRARTTCGPMRPITFRSRIRTRAPMARSGMRTMGACSRIMSIRRTCEAPSSKKTCWSTTRAPASVSTVSKCRPSSVSRTGGSSAASYARTKNTPHPSRLGGAGNARPGHHCRGLQSQR